MHATNIKQTHQSYLIGAKKLTFVEFASKILLNTPILDLPIPQDCKDSHHHFKRNNNRENLVKIETYSWSF